MLSSTRTIVPRFAAPAAFHAFLAVCLLPALASAADQAWDGGSTLNGNWSTITNWNGDSAAPGSTTLLNSADVATFNAGVANTWGLAGSPIVIDSTTQNIGGISFTGAAGHYTIGTTGGNALRVSSGGTIQILSTLTATNAIETIDAPLIIQGTNGTYTLANNSANGTGAGAGTLNIGGAISGGASGSTTLTLSGSNTNANTVSGVISNGSATSLRVIKSGDGTWILTGANTYTGLTTVSGGLLLVNGGTMSTSGGLALSGGSATITGASTVWTNTVASSTINVGASTSSNVLTISAGAVFKPLNAMNIIVGGSPGANDNMIVITGVNSKLGNTTSANIPGLYVGRSANNNSGGNGNEVRVLAGGTLFSGAGGSQRSIIGTNSNGNKVTVDGAGSQWTIVSANLYIGLGGSADINNGVLVSNGGSVVMNAGSQIINIGFANGASANYVTVQDAGSTWAMNGAQISVGSGGTGIGSGGTSSGISNVLTVKSGGAMTNLSWLMVGNSSVAANNNRALVQDAGLLQITTGVVVGSTNATGNSFDISSGGILEFTQASPTITIGSGAANAITMNGGTLSYKGVTGTDLNANTNSGNTNVFKFAWSGSNVFRLNNSTETGGGTYTFGGTGTTYTGLELFGTASITRAIVFNGNNASPGTLLLNGATATVTGGITLTGVLSVAASGAASTLTGVIGGSGTFQKTGAGTLTLASVNTYTGATQIDAGTLSVATIGNGGVAGNMGAATNAAANLVFNGGTLQYTGASASTDRNFTLNNGTISTIEVTNSAGNLTISGASTATTGALTKTGAGTLTLTGSNAYSGPTTVSAGVLRITQDSALGGSSAVLVSNGARLELSGGSTFGAGRTITIDSIGGANFIGALQSVGGTNIWAGNVIMGSLQGRLGAQAGATLHVSGVISGAAGQYLVVRNDGVESGTTILSGSNTYDGATKILGRLSVSNIGSVGGGSSNLGLASTAARGVVEIGLGNFTGTLIYTGTGETTDRVIALSATDTSGGTIDQSGSSGLLKFTSNLLLDSAHVGARTLTLQGSTAGTGEFGGVIADPGASASLAVTKSGSGTWVLSGANTYTGGTTISAGTLQLGNGGTTGSLSPSSAFTNNSTLAFNRSNTLTQGAHFSSVITGTGMVTQTGSGTTILNGANTYTGRTTVNNGALTLAFGTVTSNILSSSSALTLGGGMLQLTGTGTQTLNGLTTTASTGSRILLGSSQTVTLGALTSAGAGSALNFNTAAGGANGATVGTGLVVLTGQPAGNAINGGFTVTDSTGFGLATVNASNQIIRLTTTTLLPVSGASSATNYRINNNAGGSAAAGSATLAITASQSALSITVDSTAASGAVTLNSGVVLSTNVWNFGGSGTNNWQISGSAGGAGIRAVGSGNTIEINNYSGGTVTLNAAILANGGNIINLKGTGTTEFTGANTYTGGTTIYGGTLVSKNTASANNTLGSGVLFIRMAGTYSVITGGTIQPVYANDVTGAGAFNVTGSGGNQSFWSGSWSGFSGLLTISGGNTGMWARNSNTGSTEMRLNMVGTGGSLLGLYDQANTTSTYNVGELSGASGSVIWSEPNTNNNITLSVGALNTSSTYGGEIRNNWGGTTNITSKMGLTKMGAGTFTLTGTNYYTGVTTISGGKLSVTSIGNGGVAGNMGAATNAAANLVFNGGTLQYTGVTASTNRNFTLSAGTTSTIEVTNSASNLTITGASTATTGTLTKTGDGTLTFSSANLHTGGTTVAGGILNVTNSSGSATGSGALNVEATGTLSGTGIIAAGANTITLDGAVSVGSNSSAAASLALCTTSGSVILGATGSMRFDLFSGAGAGDNTLSLTASDLLILTGDVSILSGALLYIDNPNSMTNWAKGDMWKLWNVSGAGTITGNFALANIIGPALGGDRMFSFNSSTGILSIVPEPSRALLLLIGFIAMIGRRHRS